MHNRTPTKQSPAAFFALTFFLSAPFYVLSALAHSDVLLGPEIVPLFAALFTLTPIASASILTLRRGGWDGVKELLARIFDFRRIEDRRWYVPILFLVPSIFLLSIGVLALSGAPIPAALAPIVALPVVLLFFFVLATGEEVGWMGYAFPSMQERGTALRASLLLGVIWAAWHVPILIFVMPDPVILLSQVFTMVGTRVLIAWIFNNTGQSVFATILFHAADNAALVTMPEIQSSSTGAAVHSGLVLAAAVVVAILWGPRLCTR